MWETILTSEERAVFALRRLYREHGYETYKMSRFEEYDLYVRCRDFLPSQQIVTIPGAGGKLLALKPDVTLSVLRLAPEAPGVVQRVCYNENVYRADPATGALREILQTGLECVGDLTKQDVQQVVLLAARSLRALEGQMILTVSHMGLLRSALEGCGLSGAGQKSALACIRRKNPHALAAVCAGEGADPEKLLAILNATSLASLEPWLTTEAEREAFGELTGIWAELEKEGFGPSVRLDFSTGQDMKYYDGVVFKGYLSGIPTSVLSGGRYDRLARSLGKHCSALGFAVYVNLLNGRQTGGDGA